MHIDAMLLIFDYTRLINDRNAYYLLAPDIINVALYALTQSDTHEEKKNYGDGNRLYIHFSLSLPTLFLFPVRSLRLKSHRCAQDTYDYVEAGTLRCCFALIFTISVSVFFSVRFSQAQLLIFFIYFSNKSFTKVKVDILLLLSLYAVLYVCVCVFCFLQLVIE